MSMPTKDYISEITASLTSMANATEATQMKKYMRDQFDFLGIHAPERRTLVKTLRRRDFSEQALLSIFEALWYQPMREYKYVAIEIMRHHIRALSLQSTAFFISHALEKPWWDSIDTLTALIGKIYLANLDLMQTENKEMDQALLHESFWMRRIAMIHQLGFKQKTDRRRLFEYALELAPEKEFFIGKAIGWALRDFSKYEPQAVRGFIDNYRPVFSLLTRREALKRLDGIVNQPPPA